MKNDSKKDWYDEFYKVVQKDVPVWIRNTCMFLSNDLKKDPNLKILDLGCGQAKVFSLLDKLKVGKQINFYGVEQSETAVKFNKEKLPDSHFFASSIEDFDPKGKKFDRITLLEVIEHIPDPDPALQKIHSMLTDDGIFYLSFPNYNNLPWLLIRFLADIFNKPNWIVRQPIDHIYTTGSLNKILKRNNFYIDKAWGGDFLPHPFYKMENEKTDKFFNNIGLSRLGFHPVLVIKKKNV